MIEKDLKKKLGKKDAVTTVFISAATGLGIDKLKDELWTVMNKKED